MTPIQPPPGNRCLGVNQIPGNQNNPNIVADHYLPGPGTWQSYGNGGFRIGTNLNTSAANTYWNTHHGGTWPAGIPNRYTAYCRELGYAGVDANGDCSGTQPAPAWQPNTE